MADFKTHVTASSIVGLGYGGVAFGVADMPLPDCILAATLCGVSGMLPDIDSGPGRPLREITTFLAAMVPAMCLTRLYDSGLAQSWRVLIAIAVYAAIRYGLRYALQRYTVHRGMFHSLAAAAIFGELTFLLMFGAETTIRWFIAGGVVAGVLSHLLMDEIYSVEWDGRPRLKKSFGTAIKLFGKGWWPNISAYGKLALLTVLVVLDPTFVQRVREGEVRQNVQQIAGQLRQQLGTPGNAPQGTEQPALLSIAPTPQLSPATQDAAGQGYPQAANSPWAHQPPPTGPAQFNSPQDPYERTATRTTYPPPTYAPPTYTAPTYQPSSALPRTRPRRQTPRTRPRHRLPPNQRRLLCRAASFNGAMRLRPPPHPTESFAADRWYPGRQRPSARLPAGSPGGRPFQAVSSARKGRQY